MSWISPSCAKIQARFMSALCIVWYENASDPFPGLSMSDCGAMAGTLCACVNPERLSLPPPPETGSLSSLEVKCYGKPPKSKYPCTQLSSCEWCKAGNISPLL